MGPNLAQKKNVCQMQFAPLQWETNLQRQQMDEHG